MLAWTLTITSPAIGVVIKRVDAALIRRVAHIRAADERWRTESLTSVVYASLAERTRVVTKAAIAGIRAQVDTVAMAAVR